MPSSLRSLSANRLSAFFGGSRTDSDYAHANAEIVSDTESLASRRSLSFSKKLTKKKRIDTGTQAIQHPPSSFRAPVESGRARDPSFGNGIDALSRPVPIRSRTNSFGNILDTSSRPSSALGDSAASRSSSPLSSSRPVSRAGRLLRSLSHASQTPSTRGGGEDESTRSKSRPVSRLFRRWSNASQTPSIYSRSEGQDAEVAERKARRRSWLPGKTRNTINTTEKPPPPAWIVGDRDKLPYDLSQLLSSERVPELWDECGDTLVYLFPRTSDRGPSFKVRSSVYAVSPTLTQLAYGGSEASRRVTSGERRAQIIDSMPHLSNGGLATPPLTPKLASSDNNSEGSSRGTRAGRQSLDEPARQISLYVPVSLSTDGVVVSSHDSEIPLTNEDTDKLIAARNLFAFLVGQSLIATAHRSSLFSVFMNISNALRFYGFTNIDGSTFGEVAQSSFDCYVDELELADVRGSRTKNIEALVLGERMRSVLLYNEAFVHAVGNYSDIQSAATLPGVDSKFNLVSQVTRSRMERAWIDLQYRQKSTTTRLVDFEFPSVFAGILNSKMADERKSLDFGAWKEAFLGTRRHVLAYYKQKFGSWPPKASSKRNILQTSGLNRLVLKTLYDDFSDMYDLYVNRTSRTTRTSDHPVVVSDTTTNEDAVLRVLRKVFDEYDRSSPPVQPPIPFDTPLIPSLAATQRPYKTGDARTDAKAMSKKLTLGELNAVLRLSTNTDMLPSTVPGISPFLASMRQFEAGAARGRTIAELVSLRAGMWIFMYAVLQALPMLVIDAPGIRHVQGVECFLCEPPRSGVPWATGSVDGGTGRGRGSRSWYNVTGGSGVVSLPSDLVEHGVEGVFRRSHCWILASKWSEALGRQRQMASGLQEHIPDTYQRLHIDELPTSLLGPPSFEPLLPPPILIETPTGVTPIIPAVRNRPRPPSINTTNSTDSIPTTLPYRDWRSGTSISKVQSPTTATARTALMVEPPQRAVRRPATLPLTSIYNPQLQTQTQTQRGTPSPRGYGPSSYSTLPSTSSRRRTQSSVSVSAYAPVRTASPTSYVSPRPIRPADSNPQPWLAGGADGGSAKASRDSVVGLGLEALTMPPGVVPATRRRERSSGAESRMSMGGRRVSGGVTTGGVGSMTFDDIIGSIEREKEEERGRQKDMEDGGASGGGRDGSVGTGEATVDSTRGKRGSRPSSRARSFLLG